MSGLPRMDGESKEYSGNVPLNQNLLWLINLYLQNHIFRGFHTDSYTSAGKKISK